MKKFNVLKLVQYLVVIGITLNGSLFFYDLNKQHIKEKSALQEKHKEEIKELELENEKHVQELIQKEEKIENLVTERDELKDIVKSSRGESDRWERFRVSAYDLSVQSCGKKKTDKAYGITANGTDLKGQNWETARAIAVDPTIISLGSKVKIRFIDENYSQYDFIYTAVDTGKLIKGNKLDFFYEDTGEIVSQKAMDFGITYAYIQILY
ncbi:MAG TPA: hypothetical protein DEG71_05005 [Clostridiales bacterium]|nr:hypothetical protein [Clostridiales bacterium]